MQAMLHELVPLLLTTKVRGDRDTEGFEHCS